MNPSPPDDFERAAGEPARGGLVGEFWQFLRHNRKWWLLPIVVVLLIFSIFVVLAGTGAAPFIYTVM